MLTNKEIIENIKASPLITINETLKNNIKSVNFKKKAFFDKLWDEQTTTARWLFLYQDDTLMSRSYNKFFNINEMEGTGIEDICKTATFPIRAFKKENGYLGIVGYNKTTDNLEYMSKSLNYEIFAEWVEIHIKPFKEVLYPILKEWYTAVFEIIHNEGDKHIIPYKESCSYLLDIFKNNLEKTERLSYAELRKVYYKMKECDTNIPILLKEEVAVYNNPEELKNKLIEQVFIENSEGVVLEDSSEETQMWKVKSWNYLFTKLFRTTVRSFLSSYKKYLNLKYKGSFNMVKEEIYLIPEEIRNICIGDFYKLDDVEEKLENIFESFHWTVKYRLELLEKAYWALNWYAEKKEQIEKSSLFLAKFILENIVQKLKMIDLIDFDLSTRVYPFSILISKDMEKIPCIN